MKNATHPRAVQMACLRTWMPMAEWLTLWQSTEHGELIEAMAQRITAMPHTYQTDGQGGKALAVLHYFRGGSDWYITEKDMAGEGTAQAFGWALLNGDTDCAELGYISVRELIDNGVELDLHHEPCALDDVIAKHGGRCISR